MYIFFIYFLSVICIIDPFHTFTLFHETTLNNKKSYSTSIYRQTPLHAWIRSSVSCCPRPSQKPPTLVFFTEYHFSEPIMSYKTFKKLFWWTHVILLLQPDCFSQWLNLPSHVEKQLSHKHIKVWAADLYFCNWSFKYSNYENEEFSNVLNRIAAMYEILKYWRN